MSRNPNNPRLPMVDRLWKRVNKTENCWLWTGALNKKDGYGRIHNKGLNMRVHRVSWEIVNGPIPSGMQVLHKCDNPSCVNPDHLFLGTIQDNIKDMVAKGRNADLTGENSYLAKLTWDKVAEIRKDTRSLSGIALAYGVTKATVSKVKRRATWVVDPREREHRSHQ